MNEEAFLEGQRKYFEGSYAQFARFGGPCVYFHRECLREGQTTFLSHRQIELLYATLTAWGMHRMGDADKTKTKLSDWDRFADSILANASTLQDFRDYTMLGTPESDYSDALARLRPVYERLRLAISGATVVVNSKALYHLLPKFIPPIDRQYTIRFFRQPTHAWRGSNGKYRMIQLPSGVDAQFRLFERTCVQFKRLADRIDPELFDEQLRMHGVDAPKALDNAIVNYVRSVSAPASGVFRGA
jgi:hypothetical protein